MRRYSPQDDEYYAEQEVTDARQLLEDRKLKVVSTDDARLIIREKRFSSPHQNTSSNVRTSPKQLPSTSYDRSKLPGRTRYKKTREEMTESENLRKSNIRERVSFSKSLESTSVSKQKTASQSHSSSEPGPSKRARRSSPGDKHHSRPYDYDRRHHDGRSQNHDRRHYGERPYSRSPTPNIPHSSRNSSTRSQYKAPQPKPQPVRNEIKPMSLKECTRFHSKDLEDNQLRENEDDDEVSRFSIEGTKIRVFNLHPSVNKQDIMELFSVLGPIRRARLTGSGRAEVVYVRRDSALNAHTRYHLRALDGKPMFIRVVTGENPAAKTVYSWRRDVGEGTQKGKFLELETSTLRRALFKGGSAGTSRPVAFTVQV